MKKIYALAMLVAVMFGCKDDDPKLTVEQYLTAPTNGWIFESIIITIGGAQINAITTPPFNEVYDEPCELDDATIFTADGKFTVANNTKCDPSEDAIYDSGTWTLNPDKTSLTITSTTDGVLLVVTSLSVNGDNIKGNVTNYFDTGLDAAITLKKK